jgi:hypothetical protein
MRDREDIRELAVKDMDLKIMMLAVAVLVLAGALAYYFIIYPTSGDFLFNRNPVSYEQSANQMLDSKEICIMGNITDTIDPQRKNIMNCGVDYASSLGAINKSVQSYFIEGDECTRLEGITDIDACMIDLNKRGCYIIFIGNELKGTPKTLDSLLYVPIGNEYQNESCSVKKKVS